MTSFATTPEEIARHRALCNLVVELDASLIESIDGEWGWISKDAIRLVTGVPGLRGLGIRLSREIEDGGSAHISKDEADRIAAACGCYLGPCEPDEAPSPGSDPEMDYRIAVCRLACGLDIWTDEDDECMVAEYRAKGIEAFRYRPGHGPPVLGPITLEEHEEQERLWAERFRQRMLGVMHRGVQ